MKLIKLIFLVFLISCSKDKSTQIDTLIDELRQYPDSIQSGGITINYGFKHQILAHKNSYDSILISEKFFKPNRYLFDSCFNFFPNKKYSHNNTIAWNMTLLNDDSTLLDQIQFVVDNNIDSLLKSHVENIQSITEINGHGRFLIYVPPKGYGISGGCDKYSMAFDLNYRKFDQDYLRRTIPHEMEHLVYENAMENFRDFSSGIGVTLDEGLATYFEHKYLGSMLSGKTMLLL